MDNKLPRNRIINNLPFHKQSYCDALYRAYNITVTPNLRDVFKLWWEKEMPKVPPDTTIITDSMTMLCNAVVLQCMKEAKMSLKTGELDLRKAWGEVLNYFTYIHELFKRYQGIHIVTCHEYIDRDDKGNPTTTFSPLFTGGFKDQFASHYTDHWRMNLEEVKDLKGQASIRYRWQLKASLLFTPIVSFEPPSPFVVANYDEIKQYITKQETKTN